MILHVRPSTLRPCRSTSTVRNAARPHGLAHAEGTLKLGAAGSVCCLAPEASNHLPCFHRLETGCLPTWQGICMASLHRRGRGRITGLALIHPPLSLHTAIIWSFPSRRPSGGNRISSHSPSPWPAGLALYQYTFNLAYLARMLFMLCSLGNGNYARVTG